jgi:phage tail tape-measure protein
MKGMLAVLLILSAAFMTFSCASEGYNTQKGAAIGAIGGALAGQAIGRNTAGTLIGAATGALVGAVAGNAVDQDRANQRAGSAPRAYAPPTQAPSEAPPGEWVSVPGQWQGGKWVPAHRAWVPINP